MDDRAERIEVERVFRREYGRVVSVLARDCGSIDRAEELVQDAFVTALQRWPRDGCPPSPVGWIVTTARRRAVDQFRREASRAERHRQADALWRDAEPQNEDDDAIGDERLRLIFTCCHPALAPETQVALTLRLVGGLTTAEIARAFMSNEATLAQRLVRAKAKIRDAGIPYRVPAGSELPERLAQVLAVVYSIFNEGYGASAGDRLIRDDLCVEAVRLGRTLESLMPHEQEVQGLLALMLLSDSRRGARRTDEGDLVPIGEQDRSLWDRGMIAEGQARVRQCLRVNRPGPYQIQAAIQAVHSDAVDAAETDWRQILALYDQLIAITPTPIVALHRAVAVAEVEGPASGLAIVRSLGLDDYHLAHAIRADLLRRLGASAEAVQAYDAALARCRNDVERRYLTRRRQEVAATV